MTNSNMTCAEFDAALPDYLEGMLDDSSRSVVEAHLRECLRCAALVRDLEKIRTEAAALPELVPARDLWHGIEARIAAPVIALPARPERQRSLAPVWMGIAAAALIATTAGITYRLTSKSIRSGTDAGNGQTSPGQIAAQNSNGSATGLETGAPETAGTGATGAATEPSSVPRFTEGAASRTASEVRLASNPRSPLAQSEQVYGKEIAMLQLVVSQRRTRLDSATVAIIEQNLRIIDAAIESSRAALVKDPASLLLSEQLSHVLDKKVELLRRAALLPAST